jgi:dihydrofolate reductase
MLLFEDEDMNISLIAAMAHHRVIGKNNQLPWHLPADLKHFKTITTAKPIIMGRKTFEAIGRPLPNRQNLVLTMNPEWSAQGVTVVHSWEEAIKACDSATEIVVIGGAKLYQQTLPLATHLYLTFIDAEIEGDAFFPEWEKNEWIEINRVNHPADQNNAYSMEFVNFQRIIL